jgi:hypothetical protein
MTEQPGRTKPKPAKPPSRRHDPLIAHLTLAAVINARLKALGLVGEDIVRRTTEDPTLMTVSPAQVSKLLRGVQTTAQPETFRAIAAVLSLNTRTLWFSSGVSRGAITADDLTSGGCVCLDRDYTVVVPMAGYELTSADAVRRRDAAEAAVARRIASRTTTDNQGNGGHPGVTPPHGG